MASELADFDRKLRDIVGVDERVRPFVCEGSPLACKIFIVGFNPATSGVSFWQYWHPRYGFHKKEWLREYESTRAVPVTSGWSSTRKRIECIVAGAGRFKCLETNIYAIPSQKQSELRYENMSTRLFDFLLDTIEPRVIFAHGNPAVQHMWKMFGLPEIEPPKQGWVYKQAGETSLFAGRHLAIGWSFESARELGKALAGKCGR